MKIQIRSCKASPETTYLDPNQTLKKEHQDSKEPNEVLGGIFPLYTTRKGILRAGRRENFVLPRSLGQLHFSD